MGYTNILFDLDGTLLDTLEDLRGAVNHQLSVSGFPLRSLEEVRQFVGNGLKELMRRSLPGPCGEAELERHTADLKDWYAGHDRIRTRPYGGILPLLDHLQAAGVATAVVSNKFDRAVKDLCRDYFGLRIPVAIGERPGVARKPAPDTVLRALEELGAPREGAVYIGDSDVDIETARAAGLPCISVSWGFRDIPFLLAHGAQTIAHTPAELEELLLEP